MDPVRSARVRMGVGALVGSCATLVPMAVRELGSVVEPGATLGPSARVLPLVALLALVLFGSGLHKVLWAPPRDQLRVPKALRPFLSAFAAIVAMQVINTALGAGIGFVRGIVEGAASLR